MRGKIGQVSMEIILIVALVLIFTIPFITGLIGDFNNRVNLERKVQTATEIAQAIETVSNLGPGNSITVTTYYQMIIQNNSLVIPGETEEDNVAVQITKKVKDDEVEEGVVKIINDKNEGVVIENFPSITKLNPSVSPPGTVITITGIGFNNATIAYFNNTGKQTTYANETTIKFRVPTIGGGKYPVYVIKFAGNEELQSNAVLFSVAAKNPL